MASLVKLFRNVPVFSIHFILLVRYLGGLFDGQLQLIANFRLIIALHQFFLRLAPQGVLFFSDDDFYRNTLLVQGLIHVERHNLKALLALADELCCLGLYTPS
jgi:hypothetical protein